MGQSDEGTNSLPDENESDETETAENETAEPVEKPEQTEQPEQTTDQLANNTDNGNNDANVTRDDNKKIIIEGKLIAGTEIMPTNGETNIIFKFNGVFSEKAKYVCENAGIAFWRCDVYVTVECSKKNVYGNYEDCEYVSMRPKKDPTPNY